MIIWLNGAYGSGKTTIAELLHECISPSWIYDPEEIGDFFRKNLPKEIQKDDFQKYQEWRTWNVQILEKLNREYSGTIIVPMTLHMKFCFEEIFKSLEVRNIEVHRFLLEVSKEELIRRLNLRNDVLKKWGLSHLEDELTFFDTLPDHEKINNQQNPELVVQEILDKVGK